MLSKKKKVFIMLGMVALLVVTGCLNIYLNKSLPAKGEETEIVSSNFFVTYRADRESSRNQTVMYLDAIINNEASSQDAKIKAENDKIAITKAMETELRLEGLIKALGFDDAVVTSTSENINVILKSAQLNEEQVGKVLEVISTETGKNANNVRIIPVE